MSTIKPLQPSMIQKMLVAVENIKSGKPSPDDYRLVFMYPAMASLLNKNVLKKAVVVDK